MAAYESQMTEQLMGYCYKTNLSNELLKCSVVGVSLMEFTFKPLFPSLNLSTENFKNFSVVVVVVVVRKREKEK